jgi:hypothetical protein
LDGQPITFHLAEEFGSSQLWEPGPIIDSTDALQFVKSVTLAVRPTKDHFIELPFHGACAYEETGLNHHEVYTCASVLKI